MQGLTNLPMRSSILICVYLAKEIFSGWLTTPTAFLARFMLSLFLCLSYMILNIFFSLAENKIQRKIDSFGLGTIMLKTFENKDSGNPKINHLFQSLAYEGVFFPFEHTYVQATLNEGKRANIILFADEAIPAFLEFSDAFLNVSSPCFLVSSGYPSGLKLSVNIHNFVIEAQVFKPPSSLSHFTRDHPALFISKEYAKNFGNLPTNQGFLFITKTSEKMSLYLESVRTLMQSLNFDHYELTSPMDWIGEIKDLKKFREQAQTLSSTLIGLLTVFIFSSVSIFEFRKNLYVISLFKSFGVKPLFIFLRYFADNFFISSTSLFFSIYIGQLLCERLFKFLSIDIIGFEKLVVDSFSFSSNLFLVAVFFISISISLIPTLLALQKPVGRSLG